MADIKYVVTEECGVISDNGKGTIMKLRQVAWNDRAPKYDIRSWYTARDGSEGMNKGVTLTEDELLILGDLIDKIRAAKAKPTKAKKTAACAVKKPTITKPVTKAKGKGGKEMKRR